MTGTISQLQDIYNSSANVRAFVRCLRPGEGTAGEDGYRKLYGGGLFDSFADHPRKLITRNGISSTAAGAYQILEKTWDGLVRQYGFGDFSPASQDIACVALVAGRGALNDAVEGRFEVAVKKCRLEWASLPGSPYGQPVVTMARIRAEYEKWGGTYEVPTVAAPEAPVKEKEVLPFIAAALPSLIEAVPQLVKIFGGDTPSAVRNEQAVSVAMDVAKQALGAKNEQEMVDAIKSDPNAAATVRQAMQENWFKMVEVGGGIQAAREAAAKAQGDRPLYYNPAFVISLMLMVFPTMLLVDVFYVHPESYQADGLRTQIVTGVLMVISMIGGFWLGTSFSSSKKDDTIASAMNQPK